MQERLQRVLTILQWPLPRRPWVRWAVVLAEAALPVVLIKAVTLLVPSHKPPFDLIRLTAVLALVISGHAMAYVIATALQIRQQAQNAIYAKRVGMTFQVHET